MSDLDQYAVELHSFVAARGWDAFQNPKNLAMALGGESGELLALLQWLTPEEAAARPFEDPEFRRELAHELADILNYLLRLSRSAGIDLLAAAREKLALNEQRYPVELARGNALKYDRLTEAGEQA
ncbi:nucleotide pyrophosphohydrolase [Streptomyces chartreusis]|jgi:NTP pyrophosphatase (non-canonical NTP hydrolase)|uniref:nucleotide pyrophosphohydrolase n=1 Tax=Streptomyces TaxID=1883 RepID=UPI0004CA8552|nr:MULTISPECIES: nucleotide pyrophosphohydrolase [Streptomyces]WSZ66473.1 nucleotide pyrophosphohydrolase [Streptomyces chartreusis]WHM37972.1 nucleotide pyrophosphohydrolase [Streptomyces sp. BPTC-684]WTA30677.1 nucleotide pyrophosphohydrolase [Streptomyces chartreusis]SEB82441.1 NTP pyrophosphatase, house-cleaning of non-canonical NTPs [Streptomyces sp. KS_5]SED49023.1 NTP pyrophosphatase, house-cleaning of non-canonical NTPs [Streptomyces sp. PAN_FS17]